MGTLAGGIAHDFNNVLAGIIGFSEMVEEDLPPDSQEHKRLGLVLKAAGRGRDLVRQILTFSRAAKQDKKPLSLSHIVQDGLKLLRPTIPSTIEIITSGFAKDDVIYADPAQMHQVLLNLCTNAAHAMGQNGGVLEISITNTAFAEGTLVPFHDMTAGEYVVLTVHDTGHGMTPEIVERIFDPFFTTKEQTEGTGLGLSVVHGIIKSNGGYIGVESEPGKGSTFQVFLPKHEYPEVGLEDEQAPPIASGKERILFVDDEDMLVEWGKITLERLGYHVTALTDPARALKIFSSDPFHFDLVITDQAMPSIDGMSFAKELFKIRSDILIILCTGHSAIVSSEKAKEAGIVRFLLKPLTRHELAQAVRIALDH